MNTPALQIYNTLTHRKEPFVPIDPRCIKMYVCGPTVYNFVHIGNARPVVIFDVFFRLLQRHYPQVIYARNITDVDDKINKAAREAGESIQQLSQRFAAAFREDMTALHNLSPTLEPLATDHIARMILLIESLIQQQHAYVAEGHVLFSTETCPNYGELSGRNTEEMLAGARVEVAPYKRSPYDFVLWKPSDDDTPGWNSPWGRGRPGWHIECTAMINQHLGDTIDIHGGGQDLIFPHHENEIAQGTCAHHGQRYVNYWMHNGFITVNGEKMSKSLGNFFTVRDVLAHTPGEVVRYLLMSAHYRSSLDWSDSAVHQARASLDRLYGALRGRTVTDPDMTHPAVDRIEAYLCDDLAIPQALAVLHELAGDANRAEADQKPILQATLAFAAQRLGLLMQDPESWFKWTPQDAQASLGDEAIDALIAERNAARRSKDFRRSDEIRDTLRSHGILLEDTRDGTRWTRG